MDYKWLSNPPWPKDVRQKAEKDKLYPIEIVERDPNDTSRVKIQYIGYSTNYDEWCSCSEIVDLAHPSD